MSQKLTGNALVAYLRDNPTSDAMRAAADEIERLREALQEEADWHHTEAQTNIVRADASPGTVGYGLRATWHAERAQLLRAALAQEQGGSDAKG